MTARTPGTPGQNQISRKILAWRPWRPGGFSLRWCFSQPLAHPSDERCLRVRRQWVDEDDALATHSHPAACRAGEIDD